jgi:hypothetical protein
MAFPGYKTLGVDLSAIQTAAQLTVDGVDYPTQSTCTSRLMALSQPLKSSR